MKCKTFTQSLKGLALKWFYKLEPKLVTSYSDLTKKFIDKFSLNMKLRKKPNDLFRVIHGKIEPLKEYVRQFNNEMIKIPKLDGDTTIQPFKKGLFHGLKLSRPEPQGNGRSVIL